MNDRPMQAEQKPTLMLAYERLVTKARKVEPSRKIRKIHRRQKNSIR